MGATRTIGNIKNDFIDWRTSGGEKNLRKHFNNVRNKPLFEDYVSDETLVLKLTPPSSLHILLGISNHIWKSIESITERHKIICHSFAMKHHCVRETNFDKTFDGNEFVKLMNKLCEDESLFSELRDIVNHLKALKAFNRVRLSIFGNELKEDWKQCLDLFFNTYRNFPNITRPLKLYILSAHTNEFIEKLSIGKG